MFENFRQVQLDNGEAFQDAVCIAEPSVTYLTENIAASTDPFASKTNKYAESKVVRLFANGMVHVRFGSAAPTAVDDDFPVAANTAQYFVVDKTRPYMAVIQNSGTPDIWVTEIY